MTEHEREHAEDDALAAEYVLGGLDAAQRIHARQRMARDAGFASLVAQWEERLSPLAGHYGEEEPPRRVREVVEARLFGAPKVERSRFALPWRLAAAGLALALAISLGANLSLLRTSGQAGNLVVVLESADTPLRLLAIYDPDRDEVRLRTTQGEAQVGRALELWLVEEGTGPVSLGLLPADGVARIGLSRDMAERLGENSTLAVSLEPPGGSPTGQPTGPVVAAGQPKRL